MADAPGGVCLLVPIFAFAYRRGEHRFHCASEVLRLLTAQAASTQTASCAASIIASVGLAIGFKAASASRRYLVESAWKSPPSAAAMARAMRSTMLLELAVCRRGIGWRELFRRTDRRSPASRRAAGASPSRAGCRMRCWCAAAGSSGRRTRRGSASGAACAHRGMCRSASV